MNDANREEPSRYVPLSACDYLVDTDYPNFSKRDPQYARDSAHWTVLRSYRFLDAANSPSPWRAFYVPFIGDGKLSFVNYNLLKSKQRPPPSSNKH